MRRCLWLLALSLLAASAPAGAEEFRLYLVRHAEKAADGGADPALTLAGRLRADRLARWLAPRGLVAVWSTDYRRTRETAHPTASAAALDIGIYAPTPAEPFAQLLLERHQTALVSGHSNTIPMLAAALCQCPVRPMSEGEYNRLLVLHVDGETVRLEQLDLDRLELPSDGP